MKALWLTLIVLLLAAAPARGQKDADMSPEAKAHYDRGIAHYAAKEYDAASSELAQAYFIDPKREIVFAWAQAKRLAGDCASAIPLYRKYLASDPPAKTADKVRQHLASCEAVVGPGGEGPDPTLPKPEPVPEVTLPPEPVAALPVAPPPERTRRRPFYKDVLGDVLVGVGVAGVGVGGTFWVMSGKSKTKADEATSFADYQRAVADGKNQRTIAIVGLAAGGAALVGGIMRWAIHGGGDERVSIAVTPEADGASVVIGWGLQ